MRQLPNVALLGWAVLIFIVSSIPNPPDAGGQDWKYEAAHVVEYMVFGALAFRALRRVSAAPTTLVAVSAWALSVLYGMSDEFHQSFVPNRDASWIDVGFDATGAALGVFLAATISKLSTRGTDLGLSAAKGDEAAR